MGAVAYFLELGVIAFIGVHIGCRLMRHDISVLQQLLAAGSFALLYTVPLAIPVVRHLAPTLALYLVLLFRTEDRWRAARVLAVTWVVAFVATLLLYGLRN